MPNRTIKDSIKTSPSLDQLSDFAFRLWAHLLTVADDFGRFHAGTSALLAQAFPLRVSSIKADRIARAWGELEAAELVGTYQDNGRTYGFFKAWEKHNTPRAAKSKHPSPTSENICKQIPADAPVIESGSEGRSRTRSLPKAADPAAPSDLRAEFETEFWKPYPKKRDKEQAFEAFRKARKAAALGDIIAGLRRDLASDEWAQEGGKWIPWPEKYLKRSRWEGTGALLQAVPEKRTHADVIAEMQREGLLRPKGMP